MSTPPATAADPLPPPLPPVFDATPPRAPSDARWVLPRRGEIRRHMSSVLLIIFVSPSRYTLIDRAFDHYAPYFPWIAFVGPLPAFTTESGLLVRQARMGLSGRLQHSATVRTMEALMQGRLVVHRQRRTDNGSVVSSVINASAEGVAGYLQVSDDLVVQPWALLAYNLSRPWSPRVGLGDVELHATVRDMSSVDRAPKRWYGWGKNVKTLQRSLESFPADFLNGIRQAAATAPEALRRASMWPPLNSSSSPREDNNRSLLLPSKPAFYGVIDLFYVPKAYWTRAVRFLGLMKALNVNNEIAIPTALFALTGQYSEVELLDVHYYWLTPHCGRALWAPQISGFHRCTHNHPFAEILFDERQLAAMTYNRTFREAIIRSDAFDWWKPAAS